MTIGSPTAAAVYDGLGPLPGADIGDVLAHFVASVFSAIDEIDTVATGPDVWETLLDVDTTPVGFLPWLAQFVGARLPGRLTEPQTRSYLRDVPGWKRGTLATLEGVVRAYVGPGARITVSERTPTPYSFSVRLFEADLPGARYVDLTADYPIYDLLTAAYGSYDEYASNVDELIDALRLVKPAGLLMGVNVSLTASYDDMTADYATYPLFSTAFPFYNLATAHVP